MKRALLFTFATLLFSGIVAFGQDRVSHPITSAHIAGIDGKAELVFDEAMTDAFTVNVLDLTGKSMFMLQHMASAEGCSDIELPIENLRKGIYMVQVMSADGKTKTLKLQRN